MTKVCIVKKKRVTSAIGNEHLSLYFHQYTMRIHCIRAIFSPAFEKKINHLEQKFSQRNNSFSEY